MDGHSSTPPFLSILGFLGYSDDPGIILGWTQLTPPLSEYPGIPGILGRSWDHPGMDAPHPPLSEYPGIPGILGRSWDHPRMDTAHPPPCLSILGFLGYSDDPGIILGWTHLTPPLSEYPGIPGILGRSWDHPRMDTAHPPPCLSILGFLGYSDDPGIILGWTHLTPPLSEYPGIPGILGRSWDHPGMDTAHPPPPLSEYPAIPGILGRSWDHPRMDTAHPPPLSEYPGIPGILGRSWDHPGMDAPHPPPPPCLSILGFLRYSDDPRIIPGWMDTALPPPFLSILGFLGYSDDPGIILGWTQLTPPPV